MPTTKLSPTELLIMDWQNALPGFGVPYSGPNDGITNSKFYMAMMALESKTKAYGKLYNGTQPIMSVQKAKALFEPSTLPAAPIESTKPQTESLGNKLVEWEAFLSTTLPVVGKLYSPGTDITLAFQALEASIGKEIDKPMAGVIFNPTTKTPNTSTQDILEALKTIQSHKEKLARGSSVVSPEYFSQDDRLILLKKIVHGQV